MLKKLQKEVKLFRELFDIPRITSNKNNNDKCYYCHYYSAIDKKNKYHCIVGR